MNQYHLTCIASLALLISGTLANDTEATITTKSNVATSYDSISPTDGITELPDDNADDHALTATRLPSMKEKESIETEIMEKVGEDQIIYLIDIHMFSNKPPEADYLPEGTKEEEPEPLEEAAAYVLFTQWFNIIRGDRRNPERKNVLDPKAEFDATYEEVLLAPCRAATEIYEAHQTYYATSREMKKDGSQFTPVGALKAISQFCKRLAEDEMKQKVFNIVDRDVHNVLY